ncbi:MAG: hypothetical protein JSV63_03270 [Candidatus Aenigmatarchaeota archaeon]|nr:MAG: hypothetical protein JSV63_03270 [Candidatus Aenigmarchaeota archaeon]
MTAPAGTTTEIVEEDPSWVIYFPTLNTGQEITITYEVSGFKSTTVLDGMLTEVYAESLEEAAVEPEEVPPEPGEEAPPEEEVPPPFALDATTMMITGGIVAVIVIIAVLVFVLKSRKKSSPAPVMALHAVNSNFGQ